MVTEARKRANAKWDKENMVVLACKVKRETAEQFKAACAAQGTTSNAVLQQAVKTFLDEHPAPEQPHAARNAPDGCIVFWARFCYNEINWDLLLHTPLTVVLTIYYNNIYKYYL